MKKSYTKVHNQIHDYLLANTNAHTYKLVMYILRQTVGEQRESRQISYSEFTKYANFSNGRTIKNAVEDAVANNLIVVVKSKQDSVYQLHPFLLEKVDTAIALRANSADCQCDKCAEKRQ